MLRNETAAGCMSSPLHGYTKVNKTQGIPTVCLIESGYPRDMSMIWKAVWRHNCPFFARSTVRSATLVGILTTAEPQNVWEDEGEVNVRDAIPSKLKDSSVLFVFCYWNETCSSDAGKIRSYANFMSKITAKMFPHLLYLLVFPFLLLFPLAFSSFFSFFSLFTLLIFTALHMFLSSANSSSSPPTHPPLLPPSPFPTHPLFPPPPPPLPPFTSSLQAIYSVPKKVMINDKFFIFHGAAAPYGGEDSSWCRLCYSRDAPRSVGLLWMSDQPVTETFTWQHTQQISMLPVGFETKISASERLQTYALDRAATFVGVKFATVRNNISKIPPSTEMHFAN